MTSEETQYSHFPGEIQHLLFRYCKTQKSFQSDCFLLILCDSSPAGGPSMARLLSLKSVYLKRKERSILQSSFWTNLITCPQLCWTACWQPCYCPERKRSRDVSRRITWNRQQSSQSWHSYWIYTSRTYFNYITSFKYMQLSLGLSYKSRQDMWNISGTILLCTQY